MDSHSPHSTEEKATQKLGREDRFEIRLGEELLKRGYLTQSQLGQAMWERADSPLRLQEICLVHEWVTQEQVYSLVPTQQLRLGEILMLHNELSIDQLQSILSSQETRRPRRPIGELVVQQGWIPAERLKWALAEQEELHRLAASDSWQVINGNSPLSPVQRSSGGKESLQELKDVISGYKHQIAVLERQLAARRQPSSSPSDSGLTQGERQRYESRIQALEAQIAQTQSEGMGLTSAERQGYEDRIKGLERQLTEAQQLKDQLVAGYEARVTMLDQQLAQQRQEWETFCSQSNEEIASYHTQYQQQIQWRDLQLQQQAQQQQELQQSIVSLQFELQTAQDTLQHQHGLHQDYQRQQAEAQHQITALTTTVSELQQELDRIRQHRDTAQGEVDQLQQQLETYQAQLDKVQQTRARLISDLAEARRRGVELETQLREYQESDAVRQLQELESRLEHQIEENQTLRQEAEIERDTLSQRLRHLQEELNRQKAQNQALSIRARLSAQPMAIPDQETLNPDQQSGAKAAAAAPPKRSAQKRSAQPDQRAAAAAQEPSTSWAQRLLARLRLAGLVRRSEIPTILSSWEESQQEFTQVLSRCTGLKPETVRFFAEEGYSARLKGAQVPEDFLEAAGLISRQQLDQIRPEVDSEGSLCQTLVKRGILNQKTADYFSRTFNASPDPGATLKPSD